MKWIKRIFIGLTLFICAAFLDYFLPSNDVVQIVGTEIKRMDIGAGSPWWDQADTGTESRSSRDVRFIYAKWPNEKPRVYRNEDTGFGWPPYWKFDSANITATAEAVTTDKSTENSWVAVRHYGWRIELFTIYPNATHITRVAGPNTRVLPWFRIIFLSILFLIIFLIWRRIRRWKKKHVDPVTDKIGDELEDIGEAAGEELKEKRSAFGKFSRRWLGSGKKDG